MYDFLNKYNELAVTKLKREGNFINKYYSRMSACLFYRHSAARAFN
jgi:hypothetical protein